MTWQRKSGCLPKYSSTEHRKMRAALIRRYTPGDPCCLCGEPMWPPTSDLHADHDPDGNGYRGLAHGQCNREDGAMRAQAARRGETYQPAVTNLQW